MTMMNKTLLFLKLGGSLITDKDRPHTARKKMINRLALEIKQALDISPDVRLLIGHGSGSFGHYAAQKHQTRFGVYSSELWLGFLDVWQQARTLYNIVLESLEKANLPVISFPPDVSVITTNGQVESWNIDPLKSALENGLIPVIYGDVIFDNQLGGTILSTEELFFHLASCLHPSRILLAGLEKGVWQDFPARKKVIKEITPPTFNQFFQSIKGSASVDVTGGMAEKVANMLKLIQKEPQIKISIFSGKKSGILKQTFNGLETGTCIHQG